MSAASKAVAQVRITEGDRIRLILRPTKVSFPIKDQTCNTRAFKRSVAANKLVIGKKRGSIGIVREVDKKRNVLLVEFEKQQVFIPCVPIACCQKIS